MQNVIAIILVLVHIGLASIPGTKLMVTAGIGFLQEEKEEFRETYEVKPGTKLEVYNINGNITVSKWDKTVVQIYALKKTRHGKDELEKVKVEVNTDDGLTISTKYLEKNAKVSVNYTIQVPANVEVDRLETSNGEIALTGTIGDATVMTSNGEIDIKEVTGSIVAETSNGEITIEGSTDVLRAVTSNGEVTIKRATSIVEAATSNGSIEAEILNVPDDGITVETSNGSITLYVKDGLNADIKLTTSLGSVSVHDIEISASKQSKTYLKGKIGDGGSLIEAETSNGNVDLYKIK